MTDKSLWSCSRSLKRLEKENCEPYQHLAFAIIAVAVDDYRSALVRKDKEAKKEIEEFFQSDYFEKLTTLDYNVLIQKVKKERVFERVQMAGRTLVDSAR